MKGFTVPFEARVTGVLVTMAGVASRVAGVDAVERDDTGQGQPLVPVDEGVPGRD
jgi:hypothetical protein